MASLINFIDPGRLGGRKRTPLRMIPPAMPVRFDEAFSREAIYRALLDVRRHGGPAAGEDGVSPRVLTPSECGSIAGELFERLWSRPYEHGPTRVQNVSKGPGRGTRRIDIPNVPDRAVAKCLTYAFYAIADDRFRRGVVGCRPHRDRFDGLAQLAVAVRAGHTYFLKADVADAFGHVRREAVLKEVRQIPSERFAAEDLPRFIGIVDAVLRGGRPDRERGIDQGSPFSPMALNLILRTAHDRPLVKRARIVSWVRYVDDCGYLGATEWAVFEAFNRVSQTVADAGFGFKLGSRVIDLRTEPAEFLGFRLRVRDGHLTFAVTEESKAALREKFESAMLGTTPSVKALALVRSWVAAHGQVPRQDVCRVAYDVAQRVGFVEIPKSALHEAWDKAHGRWEGLLRRWDRPRPGVNPTGPDEPKS